MNSQTMNAIRLLVVVSLKMLSASLHCKNIRTSTVKVDYILAMGGREVLKRRETQKEDHLYYVAEVVEVAKDQHFLENSKLDPFGNVGFYKSSKYKVSKI